jgi:hypothetical protein
LVVARNDNRTTGKTLRYHNTENISGGEIMRLFAVCVGGKYMVAIKANKRKSKTFYYMHVSFRGVEFVLDKEKAYSCYDKETAEFLANKYLRKRIEDVGFVLREF